MGYELADTDGRALIWTVRYQAIFALDEAEAVDLVTRAALRDVPDATVKVLSVRLTPAGRFSVIVKREREASR